MTPPTFPARPKNGGQLDLAIKAGMYQHDTDQWTFEPKVNGWRALVHTPTGQMWNRHGQRLSIERDFTEALAAMRQLPFEWLDVEGLERRHDIMRGCLIVLDWVMAGGSHTQRRQVMQEFICDAYVGMEKAITPGVRLVTQHNRLVYELLPEVNERLGCTFYEGVVAKRRSSLYPIQLRSPEETTPDWVKHRHTNIA